MSAPTANQCDWNQYNRLEDYLEIIDTHCHLSFDPLAGDLDAVLLRAEAAGVSKIVVPAYDLESWPVVGEIAKRERVFAAFGLHPWKARQKLDVDALSILLTGPNVVAVGEIGLDFKVDGGVERERQLSVFQTQVEMACDLDLPVILHCRGAFQEMLGVLGHFAPSLRGVLHAYSRGPEIVRQFLDLGLFVAFGGAVTRPHANRARRSVLAVPSDRMLTETDAPSIGLDGVDAEHAEPRHVLDVVLALAVLRGEKPEQMAAKTTANANRLFRFER